ncbi:MAG: PDZ domain-containing protein, partial [Pseudomonadota bacterium]
VRGWLGVRIQSVTPEIAESLGLPDAEGALVASVTPGGPAANAGIQAGDVIVEFDGEVISAMRGLPRIVAETEVGTAVDVEIWRRGEQQTIEVTLGELPSDEELAQLDQETDSTEVPLERAELPGIGLVVAAISPEMREMFQLAPDVAGVVVIEVMEGSPAAAQRLQAGDVILEVGQDAVETPADVVARITEAREGGKRSVLFLVDRQGDLSFVAVRLES